MLYLEKKYQKYLGFNDYWFLLIGIPVVSLVIPFLFFDEFTDPTFVDLSFRKLARSGIYTTLYWFIVRSICIHLRIKYPSEEDIHKRLSLSLLSTVVVVSFLCPCIEAAECYSHIHGWDSWLLATIRSMLISFILISVCMGIYESIYYLTLWKKSKLETEQLKKNQLASQLQTLRNQVNPHFLFNSLNTLSAVIPDDPDLAVDFVENLSRVYRYILEVKDNDLIPLRDELVCIDSYLFLLHTRFGKKFITEVDLEGLSDNLMILPMSLQLLIENALKHNVVSKAKPLTISVTAAGDSSLLIENNFQPKLETAPSTNVGLENINSRLEILGLPPLEVSQTDSYFRVKLPLLKVQHHANIDH